MEVSFYTPTLASPEAGKGPMLRESQTLSRCQDTEEIFRVHVCWHNLKPVRLGFPSIPQAASGPLPSISLLCNGWDRAFPAFPTHIWTSCKLIPGLYVRLSLSIFFFLVNSLPTTPTHRIFYYRVHISSDFELEYLLHNLRCMCWSRAVLPSRHNHYIVTRDSVTFLIVILQ